MPPNPTSSLLLIALVIFGGIHAEPPPESSPANTVGLPVMTWFHPVLEPGVGDITLLCTVVSAGTKRQIYDSPYWDVRLRIDERIHVDVRYQKRLEGIKFIDSGDFRRRKAGERIVLFAGGEPYEGNDFLKPCWKGTKSDLGIVLYPPHHLNSLANERLLEQLRGPSKARDESDFFEAFAEFCPQGVARHFIRELSRREQEKSEREAQAEMERVLAQMRGFSMQRAPSRRSDGTIDPMEQRKSDILDKLRKTGEYGVLALARALEDPDVQLRRNVALAMFFLAAANDDKPKIDIRDALPDLITATTDTDAIVRAWAAQAISAIGPEAKEAVPALIRLLGDSEEGPRNDSCIALGSIGPAAKEALFALRKALNDPRTDVRRFAQSAIEKIEK